MKKVSLFAVVLSLVASSSIFAAAYNSAGCGLGSMMFKNEGFVQVFAATFNGSFYSQTFGISSGTSNCGGGGKSASLPAFAEANKIALANDIAKGNGETLVTLSETLGCSDAASLNSALQKNYRSIFPSTNVPGEDIASSIENVVKQDAELAKTCKIVG